MTLFLLCVGTKYERHCFRAIPSTLCVYWFCLFVLLNFRRFSLQVASEMRWLLCLYIYVRMWIASIYLGPFNNRTKPLNTNTANGKWNTLKNGDDEKIIKKKKNTEGKIPFFRFYLVRSNHWNSSIATRNISGNFCVMWIVLVVN